MKLHAYKITAVVVAATLGLGAAAHAVWPRNPATVARPAVAPPTAPPLAPAAATTSAPLQSLIGVLPQIDVTVQTYQMAAGTLSATVPRIQVPTGDELDAIRGGRYVSTVGRIHVTAGVQGTLNATQSLPFTYTDPSTPQIKRTSYLTVGRSISVTPSVRANGNITLEVHVRDSEPGNTAPGALAPVINAIDCQTTVTVSPGHEVLVSGLPPRQDGSMTVIVLTAVAHPATP